MLDPIVGKYSVANVFADHGEKSALDQIKTMTDSPAMANPIAIMPDFHAGKGSVVGFTMKAGGVIIPNVVGVDIGCGMTCRAYDHLGAQSRAELDTLIRSVVPVGFNVHKNPKNITVDGFTALAQKVGMDVDYMYRSLGTLGGGNHFIEIGIGMDKFWITVHTGSRNLGVKVAEYHQKKAVAFSGHLPGVEKGLEYCEPEEYLADMHTAQLYASINRQIILSNIEMALDIHRSGNTTYESVHNYIDDSGMIRKGATSAELSKTIILPFNRTEGIWIMRGLGNPDWNYSAPHGAGRVMSRGEAKRKLNQAEQDELMEKSGVYSSANPLDESPAVYKTPEEVRRYLGETAEFMFAIKPILNIKDGN